MPNFYLWPKPPARGDSYWVYGIDAWDARDQIATTLGLAARDDEAFGCHEDDRFKAPLNTIVHDTGEWTEVSVPHQLRSVSGDDDKGGPENLEL
ncbi:hypothetical protein [Beijerinckia sp. L45]|uniref:hypothetical protein n=1 Tax=Beijerinckia sp. L45 TaxID=1641855 RepID=UPI00131D6F6F|nr:hypothetical protein [Beijerinckia sp. L45]